MKQIKITENALRDGIQSLLATRVKTQDMLEVAKVFEEVGFHSVEVWGGATYDACLRFLNEDPFERLYTFKEIFKTTPLQMLLRGQNLVGYRHYAPDVVKEFIALSAKGGIDIFRIFDALNDSKNVKLSIEEVRKNGKHAQGAICYTTSPVHHLKDFVAYGKELVAMGCQSLAIKDMAGLLLPFEAYELVKALKEEVGVELSIHIHATTGFAFASHLKALEAGADVLDLSNSALSGGTSHPSTQAMVATLQNTQWESGLSLEKMEEASRLLKAMRTKYSQYESSFNHTDTEILLTQIPGGMISNLANQLREQNALDKMEEVAQEIIRVRADFGYIPLVTPTSQIVGSQAVLNVLQKERYKTLTTESKNLLLGLYGRTPAVVSQDLLDKVVGQEIPELPTEEMPQAIQESKEFAKSPTNVISYALFGEVAKTFLLGQALDTTLQTSQDCSFGDRFDLILEGKTHSVEVMKMQKQGQMMQVKLSIDGEEKSVEVSASSQGAEGVEPLDNAICSPMAGICTKIFVEVGQRIQKGDVLGIIEAMKMENEVVSPKDGVISEVRATLGSSVQANSVLFLMDEEQE